ncbi:MAG TPA: S-methyl-5-thioribose kinase [Terriglobia bacterium]|nr:S-methyl-5-thioribose kinase [Terriglobia bacterium]
MKVLEKTRYEPLTAASLPQRLAPVHALKELLGPATHWRVREVGDGNLNLIFIVESPRGSLVVKQALPYARVVGDSWPMSLDRTFFEYNALMRLDARDPGRLPKLHYFDEKQALIVMEHLHPHVILRKALIDGLRLPDLGKHLGRYLARTLFRGSDLCLNTADRKADLALFARNVELTGITEDLFFTDPFIIHSRNRHTPGLESSARAARQDMDLKLAARMLKAKFCSRAETLLHGDLHTGSVMVTETDSRVIDAEFAVYGPMGFDIGSLLGNFWLAYFAQQGHQTGEAAQKHGAWILEVARTIWRVFTAEFSDLWRRERTGILGGREFFEESNDAVGSEIALQQQLTDIWRDSLGFAGIEMHRRILGLAHAAELEAISDEPRRAACERRALEMGRALAVHPAAFPTISAVNRFAMSINDQ